MVSSEINTEKLLKAMKDLPIRVQKNIMVGATRAGANVVRDEAKARVRVSEHGQKYGKYPHKAGNLKKSIGVTRRRDKRGIVSFSISPRKGGLSSGFYGKFVELGTSKMSAKPFLRPAAETKVNEVLVASKEYIAKRLPIEVAKAKK